MGEDMTVHFNMKAAGFVACVAAIAFITGAQAAGWDDGGGEAWQKVLEAAKKEGPVVGLIWASHLRRGSSAIRA